MQTCTNNGFALPLFFGVEVGEQAKTELLDILYQQFGDETFADIRTSIEEGTLTDEQIDEMREEIIEQMEEILGPLQYLLIDIPLLSDLEDALPEIPTVITSLPIVT